MYVLHRVGAMEVFLNTKCIYVLLSILKYLYIDIYIYKDILSCILIYYMYLRTYMNMS
jgi:hypothetical protein